MRRPRYGCWSTRKAATTSVIKRGCGRACMAALAPDKTKKAELCWDWAVAAKSLSRRTLLRDRSANGTSADDFSRREEDRQFTWYALQQQQRPCAMEAHSSPKPATRYTSPTGTFLPGSSSCPMCIDSCINDPLWERFKSINQSAMESSVRRTPECDECQAHAPCAVTAASAPETCDTAI
jgi:hypothetical protein